MKFDEIIKGKKSMVELEMLSAVCIGLAEVCNDLARMQMKKVKKKKYFINVIDDRVPKGVKAITNNEINRSLRLKKNLESKAKIFKDFGKYYLKLKKIGDENEN